MKNHLRGRKSRKSALPHVLPCMWKFACGAFQWATSQTKILSRRQAVQTVAGTLNDRPHDERSKAGRQAGRHAWTFKRGGDCTCLSSGLVSCPLCLSAPPPPPFPPVLLLLLLPPPPLALGRAFSFSRSNHPRGPGCPPHAVPTNEPGSLSLCARRGGGTSKPSSSRSGL